MKLEESGDVNDGKDSKNGLEYKEYLRMLLFLQKKDKLRLRTMDLIEKNLQIVYGQSFFHMDDCISRLEIESCCELRRGVRYCFKTYFGYQ